MTVNRYLANSGGSLDMVVPATVSSGSATAGQLVALNAAGAVDITMMPSGIGANTFTGPATAAISAGMLVNVYSNAGVASIRPADCTTDGSRADGYATSAITSGATGTVNLGPGGISGLSGLTIGSSYFLGTVGSTTTTAPTTAGNVVQAVGKALSTTELDFQPSQVVIVVA